MPTLVISRLYWHAWNIHNSHNFGKELIDNILLHCWTDLNIAKNHHKETSCQMKKTGIEVGPTVESYVATDRHTHKKRDIFVKLITPLFLRRWLGKFTFMCWIKLIYLNSDKIFLFTDEGECNNAKTTMTCVIISCTEYESVLWSYSRQLLLFVSLCT